MPRKPGPLLALTAIAVLLCIPASAAARTSDAYSYLANSRHNPAPLAPTSLPASIGSFNDAAASNTEKGNNYTLLFTHQAKNGFDASLVVLTVGRRSLSKEKRLLRPLYRTRKTKVRGHPALVFKRKKGQGTFLAWVEDGVLYLVGTATTKKVSNADLFATANSLEHLRGAVFGESLDTSNIGASAVGYVMDRHLLLELRWAAPCQVPSDPDAGVRAQNDGNVMTALNSGSFAVGPVTATAFNASPEEPPSWNVSASGTTSVAGGQMSAQVSGAAGATTCAVGPLTFGLQPRP